MIRMERRCGVLGRTFRPDGLCVRDEEGQGSGFRCGGGDMQFLVCGHGAQGHV